MAPAATSSGHQSDRFGGTCTPTSGISRRECAISSLMSSIDTDVAHSGMGVDGGAVSAPVQRSREASSAMSATSAP